MRLELAEVIHQYITKMVVFTIFLYKRQIRQPNIFNQSVNSFLKKRLLYDLELVIDTGIKLDKEEEREILLTELLDGIETDYLSTVTVSFKTPLKLTTIVVNLKEEDKYEKFIYS
jgi:hypothetical protein